MRQDDAAAVPANGGPGSAPSGDGGSPAGEALFPPGVKLFGEEKRRRDRLVAEAVARHVDPATGRLRAEDAQRVYREVGLRFGLSPSGVIQRTPGEIKPTNQETLEFARSQKGKYPRGERVGRRRGGREAAPPQEERLKKRSPHVQRLVKEAAQEFVDPATGRIPASRATEVYHLLAERFQRTPGTVSNYLKGLTPTSEECAKFRWQRERERQNAAAAETAPAARAPEPEPDYASHPAALFPTQPQAPPPRRGPRSLKEREAELRAPDGRLIDYDDAYQRRIQAETVETKLDDATQEFLRTFRLQQANEFISALRDCGRSMNNYVIHTERQLQQFQQGLEAAVTPIRGVAEAIQELRQRHARDMDELRAAKDREIQALREQIAALEAERSRILEFFASLAPRPERPGG